MASMGYALIRLWALLVVTSQETDNGMTSLLDNCQRCQHVTAHRRQTHIEISDENVISAIHYAHLAEITSAQCTMSVALVVSLVAAALKHPATTDGSNFSLPHPIVGKAIEDILSFTAILKQSDIKSCNICHKTHSR